METGLEHDIVEREREDGAAVVDPGMADNGGVGAAIAMLIALSTFLLAVVFILVRHALFGA
jgi:hypothetical protein